MGKTDAIVAQGDIDWTPVLTTIQKIETETDARKCIDDMTRLEHALADSRMMKRCICDFCKYEALMWVNITAYVGTHGGDLDMFTKSELALIDWLKQKNNSQVAKVLAQCARGRRIANVRSDEVGKANEERRESEYRRISDLIISEAAGKGVTNLTTERFYKEWSEDTKPNVVSVRAYTERTRDALLNMGCLGFGDGDGTYAMPESCDSNGIACIIDNRVSTVLNAIESLKRISQESNVPVPTTAMMQIERALDELRLVSAKAA